MDPQSPDHFPTRTSLSRESSHYSPSLGPGEHSIDDSRLNSNPPSRRQSEIMAPPPNITKVTQSEASPPTNNELKRMERRQSSTTHKQSPLLENLSSLTESTISIAVSTLRHDAIKKEAVAQQRERDRQSKLKHTFLTLIEDADSRVESLDKASVETKKQLTLNMQAQSKRLVAIAGAVPSVHDYDRLKDDFAEMKAEMTSLKKETGINPGRGFVKDDVANLKAELETAWEKIRYLEREAKREAVTLGEVRNKLDVLATKDELRKLADKDEHRELATRDELRRVTTKEVEKQVIDALAPFGKKIADLKIEDASLLEKIKAVDDLTQKHRKTAEAEDQQQSSRFDLLDTSLRGCQSQLSRLERSIQEGQNNYAADKVNQEVLNKQMQEKIAGALQQIQAFEAASKLKIPPQTSQASANADTKLDEEIKLMGRGLDDLKAEQEDFKTFRHDLDAFKADQEKLSLIRTDLDTLISAQELKDAELAQGFEEIDAHLCKHDVEISRLQADMRLSKQTRPPQSVADHPPISPFARGSMSPQEINQRKLQDIDIGLKVLTKNIQGLDLVVQTQQQKFESLTTDRLVQSMIHQMQLMYPQHPGLLNEWRSNVDRQFYIFLERFAKMDSQIAALVSPERRNEILQISMDTRKVCSDTIESVSRNFENLKDRAIGDISQISSDNGNRIKELEARMMTIETKYITAIDDIQTNVRVLARGLTHAQNRNGINPASNMSGELNSSSRSSQSAEPKKSAAVSSRDDDGSESDISNTPLRQRRAKRKAPDSDEDAMNGKKFARRNVSGTGTGRNQFAFDP